MTPYYADDMVTLYCGDMREVLPALGIEPNCVVVDPPYSETSLKWDRWPDGWLDVVASAATSMWCFLPLRQFAEPPYRGQDFRAASWKLSHDVTWDKGTGTGIAADRFRRSHEPIMHWYRGRWADVYKDPQRDEIGEIRYTTPQKQGRAQMHHLGGKTAEKTWVDDGTRLAKSVLRFPPVRGGIHPTQKPVPLLDPLIRFGCPPGGLVLDCFAGSCSTGVAARLSGRRSVLIESDEAMCEKAVTHRLAQDVLPIGGAR